LKILVIFFFLNTVSSVFAEGNPFMGVRDRDQWAIEQVLGHKAPDESLILQSSNENYQKGTRTKSKRAGTPIAKQVFQTQIYNFQTETDQAKINVEVTDYGNSFLVDVNSDQTIQGWLLKRQSTREVFLKGGAPTDNQYKCRIKVDRPYLKDFGLTVYVTKDSDPAFIQLF